MALPNDPDPKLAAYAHPERLVTTSWLAEHLGVDVPLARYALTHLGRGLGLPEKESE